jgi:hypothetical protein
MRVLVLMLSLLSLPAIAAEFTLGPWRLGMSREEVQSFAEHGPYKDVAVTGGLETFNAHVLGGRKNVSFVFDDAGLEYIQLWGYEGADYKSAKAAVLELFDLFVKDYGGAEVPGVNVSGQASLDRASMEVLLDRILGTAKDLGKKEAKERTVMLLFFDMKPKRQPEGSRLHSQWGYHSKFDTFYVFLYQDREDAPERSVGSNVRLEAL